MALRTKAKHSTNRRRTVLVRSKPKKRPVVRVTKRHTKSKTRAPEPKPVVIPDPSQSTGYVKALRYLATLTDHERLRIVRYNSTNFDLDRMRTLLKNLGKPHEQFKSVHVAGTKGKGSTCAMTAAMLQTSGYRVGLYSSPHLCDIRERIQINGEMISHADLARLVRQVEPIASRMKQSPTFFDAFTAIAFKYFAEHKVDVAIVETGLGGRLDSTNVLRPEVTAITSISKDHMAQLGHTLPKIAEEKAGIFKKGVPAVSVTQHPDVEAVLTRVANK